MTSPTPPRRNRRLLQRRPQRNRRPRQLQHHLRPHRPRQPPHPPHLRRPRRPLRLRRQHPPRGRAAPASQPAPVAAATASATSPLGIWATEDNKGNVRIEECGTSLCGYAVNSNEKILINMKPQGAKWTGRIHDPDSGRNYNSTIALKGPNTLKVQGCAFGGMFCGGQTWKRVS